MQLLQSNSHNIQSYDFPAFCDLSQAIKIAIIWRKLLILLDGTAYSKMQLKLEVHYIFVETASATKFQRLMVAITIISRLKTMIYFANYDYNFLEFRQNE